MMKKRKTYVCPVCFHLGVTVCFLIVLIIRNCSHVHAHTDPLALFVHTATAHGQLHTDLQGRCLWSCVRML